MPLSTQRKVALGFIFALVMLAAIGGASYAAMRSMEEAAVEERSSLDMLAALSGLDQIVTEAETGQRGFLLTGQVQYLGPYRRARQALPRAYSSVRRWSAAEDSTAVERVIDVSRRKVDELAATVEAASAGQREQALATVATQRGRLMMDTLHAEVEALRVRELGRYDERQERGRSEVQRVGRVVTLGLVVTLMVALVATGLVARDERSREATRLALERARDAAEAGSRAKSEFLARMSHELRTPLNAVIGFAGVLLRNRRNALDDQELSYLRRIQASGNHLLTIINDILDLSRVESGRMDVHMTTVDLASLVQATADSFAGTLDGGTVELAVQIQDRPAPITTDESRLRQVIGNLIANALKFTENGRVLVRLVAGPRGEMPLRLDVIDEGIGIPIERREAIFGAFEQAENSISRRYGGTGLGLSISRTICEKLGLRLVVASEEGVGSTFSILFDPAAEPPGAHVRSLDGVPVQRVSERTTAAEGVLPASRDAALVLIVDDSADSRLLLSQYMDDFGLQSIAAVGGEQGVQMALEFKPDLVLLDLEMPVMNGWEVVERLRRSAATRDTPIVLVSVVGSREHELPAGTQDIVAKPVSRGALHAVVRRHLPAHV